MTGSDTIGYAVVGLGWISQAAMLPAFANARRNSRLAALVSGDEAKRRRVARRYDLHEDATFGYDDYDACLERDDVQAVYIAVPNHLHRQYAVRAAEKGVHVLCEKPMAPAPDDCRAMIDACRANGVKLMVAYRLHLEPAQMRAVELVEAGAIGQPRLLNATFTQQVSPDDTRLAAVEKGGGPIFDIGIYCLNAARYLFRAEPVQVRAAAGSRPGDDRFGEAHTGEASPAPEEMASCILEFPGDRHAAFTCSFGAAPVSSLRLVGTDGEIGMAANAFNFQGDRELRVVPAGDADDDGQPGTRSETFPTSDQFGPQLAYFSDCILEDRRPEPDGEEGLIDVMIIRALYESMASGRPIELVLPDRSLRPGPELAVRFPAIEPPDLVDAAAPDE